MRSETESGLLVIDDPEIDVDAIVEEIRVRIHQRRHELGEPRQSFPSFGTAAFPGEPRDRSFDADLYYHLRKVNDLHARFCLDPVLADSPVTAIPVVGALWRRVRLFAHQLVLFYVQRAVREQVAVNRHLVGTLNRIAVVLEMQEERIRALDHRPDESGDPSAG